MNQFKIKYTYCFILTAIILFAACTKEQDDIKLEPKLATTQVLNIKSDSARIIGFVAATGSGFTEKGVCYDIAANPTIASNKVVFTGENTTAAYSVQLAGLAYATKYYARAYATNSDGTIYGDELTFTTSPILPTLLTTAATEITDKTVKSGGNITNSGGADITARGICWSKNANPTITDSKTTDGEGTGVFISSITELTASTKYYVRAYATNSVGTIYGNQIEFTTNAPPYPAIGYLVGSVNGWNNHGLYLAARGNNIHVGYNYLDGTSEFKFFPQRDSWDNGWGRDGDKKGTVVQGGGNIKAIDEPTYSTPGFYEIKFDLANGTVTLTKVAMGVIGDAQAGGWDTDVNLTFNTTSKKWEGQVTFLASGAYKFRANDAWAINFGGDLTNLVQDGANFTTPGAGVYNISLDLSGVDKLSATVTP